MVDRTEKSFGKHFLLILSYVLSDLFFFKVIIGEDFDGIVGAFLPNFYATGKRKIF